jgi:cytochrome c-type biogenesis protein CcmF
VRLRRGENALIAAARLLARNRRRYGGYTVHLGILLMLVGITASSMFVTQGQATLRAGERFRIGAYELEFSKLEFSELPGIEVTGAVVRVFAGARLLATMVPQQYFYRSQQQAMHHVAIRSSPREDLYLILSEWGDNGRVTLRALLHPLVSWLWAGGAVLVAGALFASIPERRRRAVAT